MTSWPGSLPQKPLLDGNSEVPPKTTVRTQMDAGPAKVRRRFTAGTRDFNAEFIMSKSQVATFDDFYINTINGGANRFDFDNPRTGTTHEFRIVDQPQYQKIGPDAFRVSMKLEQLP